MTPLFDGKRALVTGGGTGIGRAAALALAAQGCFVTVAERTEMTLQQTVELIEGAGGSAQLVICDVTDKTMVQAAVHAAAGDQGQRHLDVAVNSAGYDGQAAAPTADWTDDMLDQMLTTNVRGTFLPMKYELAWMRDQGFSSTSDPAPGCSAFQGTPDTLRPNTPGLV
jgi:NAD(P)-dependent dehydrogenase (short-subunit alcohol dehydrogenase family)